MQAENIDAKKIWCNPLSVKRINATDPAEKMSGGMRMELILRQGLFACKQSEFTFVHLDHHCVFAAADRTIAGRQLGKVGFDFELHGTAVAAALMALEYAMRHQAQPAGL